MKVFTTGSVAKLVGASPVTVRKWFDAGYLKGWRIPGGRDRRVPERCLVAFLREYGMPVPGELNT